jgi:hypothetical protein
MGVFFAGTESRVIMRRHRLREAHLHKGRGATSHVFSQNASIGLVGAIGHSLRILRILALPWLMQRINVIRNFAKAR